MPKLKNVSRARRGFYVGDELVWVAPGEEVSVDGRAKSSHQAHVDAGALVVVEEPKKASAKKAAPEPAPESSESSSDSE